MDKNQDYTLEVIDINNDGAGVGKYNNFTVFIPNCVNGDVVDAKIIKVKKSYAIGKLINIVTPSPLRTNELCVQASKCGGCQLQHINYDAQLEFKQKRVRDCMERIAKIKNIPVLPTIGMQNPSNYRNKAQYPIKNVDGVVQIGFFAKKSHRIVESNECIIQDARNAKIVEVIRLFLLEQNISIYDEMSHKGLVRHLLIKSSFHLNQIMVCLVINGKKLPKSDLLVKQLCEIDGVCSIVINHNTNKGNVVLGDKVCVLYGKDFIEDKISELVFKISPLSFFQVNPTQTEILYNKVLEFANLAGDEIILDLYCGIGTISLFLAKAAKKVYGVEVVSMAIDNAIENAKINGIDNAEFILGKAEDAVPDIKADVVVVDPPRKGCDESVLKSIVQLSPNKIIYVSCDPATLARDVAFLDENGYNVDIVQPIDMFPHTTHVETVVLLSRN
ncbi:MAG: 23S rRNA (uracil-5-)-methyltransferase RumA [Epulopiscium sp. Nele67-Bin001]|nr:MAG: 23S rRNA (uracil-5-)-methyltransferase RumA [Epulopiscium sp. Nele67-Bin001]